MRIFRISNILFFAAATTFGVMLFWTSQAVQQKEEQLSAIKKKLTQETETVRVLSVEWDYLNRPQRLEELAREQLGMAPASVGEMVKNASDIPEPIIVNTDPQYFEAGIAQTVSIEPAAGPAPVVAPKPETVSPSRAEKQDFEKLIQSLSDGGAE